MLAGPAAEFENQDELVRLQLNHNFPSHFKKQAKEIYLLTKMLKRIIIVIQ